MSRPFKNLGFAELMANRARKLGRKSYTLADLSADSHIPIRTIRRYVNSTQQGSASKLQFQKQLLAAAKPLSEQTGMKPEKILAALCKLR